MKSSCFICLLAYLCVLCPGVGVVGQSWLSLSQQEHSNWQVITEGQSTAEEL